MSIFILINENQGQVLSSLTLSNDSIPMGGKLDVYFKLTVSNPAAIRQLDYTVFDTLTPTVGMAGPDAESPPGDIDWNHDFTSQKKNIINLRQSSWRKTNSGFEYRDTISGEFWDFGLYTIDHPKILQDTNQRTEIRKMQSPMVLVYGPRDIVNEDTTTMILPIKPILDEPRTFEDYLWILYTLIGLILAGALLYYFRRKNETQEVVEKVIIKRPAHVIAFEKLELLKAASYWTKGEEKKHHTEFTYIIREYLENRFGINALESTTEEINRALKKEDFKITHENDLKEMLQIADLVKFAKAKPPVDINEQFLEKAKLFIKDTLDAMSQDEEIIVIEKPEDAR